MTAPTPSVLELEPDLRSGTEQFGALTPLLAPRSIAIVGASDRDGNAGGAALGFLQKFGFKGDVWPVNPGRKTVGGVPCLASLADLPATPDLALVAVPAAAVTGVIDDCGHRGIPAAISWAGGFSEVGPTGQRLQAELERVATGHGIKLCGPNCLGIINTAIGMTGSFGSMLGELDRLRAGQISMVSQSGGIGTMAHAKAEKAGFGFRITVSCGNEAVLSVADFIKALAVDPGTRVIAVYVEGIRDPGAFVDALAEARRNDKPVVIIKGGASAESQRAALAHTGRLSGEDRTFDALVREFAAIRVHSLEEMLDVALQLATLHEGRLPAGDRVMISTFGGGSGVLATDQCNSHGISVPQLSPATQERAARLLTPIAAVGNPVDLTPQSLNDPQWRGLLPQALETLVRDPSVDSYLFLAGGLGHRANDIADLIEELRHRADKPVLASWLFAPDRGRADLAERGIFVFPEHARAARALSHLVRHEARKRAPILRTEPSLEFDWRNFVDVKEGVSVVSEDVVAGILMQAGLAVAPGVLVRSREEIGSVLSTVGFPAVAKAISPEITHRAAAGFLALNLSSTEQVVQADARFRKQAAERGLTLEGTWVQRMISGRRELLATAFRDPDYGVVVGCGLGGGMTEILDDIVFARAPIDEEGARNLVSELSILRRRPDFLSDPERQATAEFIARLSQLALTAPWPSFTLEVNPILVSEAGATAVDGLLIVGDA